MIKFISTQAEPLQHFLFYNTGSIVQHIKTKISPAFTPSKLKNMFYSFQGSLERFDDYLEGLLLEDEYINCNDLIGRLTADMIGNCFIGININTLTRKPNKENKFLKYFENVRGASWKDILKHVLIDIVPQFYNLIGYYIFDNVKMTQFYINLTNDIMEQQKKYAVSKHDFINLLIEMKENPGKLAEVTGKIFLLIIYISI